MRNERDKDKREELEAAGWRPEEREGETVWQHPESRLWYPEGVAIAMLREGADANVPLDAEGGTQASREASPERGSDRRPYEEPGPLR